MSSSLANVAVSICITGCATGFSMIPSSKSYEAITNPYQKSVYPTYAPGIIYNKVKYNDIGDKKMIFTEKKLKNLEKLKVIEKLEYNWNDNGATAFDKVLIKAVSELVMYIEPQPNVFPTALGSIQIEYEKDNGEYLEFEVFSENKIKMFYMNDLEEKISLLVSISSIQGEVTKFYGKKS